MRLKIELLAKDTKIFPFNYHYQVSSALYLLLKFSSPEFSEFLHNNGFKLNGKPYKLFSFSVKFEKYKVLPDAIYLESPIVYLTVSSAKIDEFIRNVVIGSFERTFFYLSFCGEDHKLIIRNIELLPEPRFYERMKFFLNSPLVISTIKEFNGKRAQHYLRVEETEEINRILTRNLCNKYELINNVKRNNTVQVHFDEEYLKKHPRVTKKITINEHGRYPIDIVGIQAPFSIQGDPELIKVGYDCGFGEKNSMGFGMAEVIKY